MRILGLYVFAGRSLDRRDSKIRTDGISEGFQNAVESLIKAIESKDKIILGNGVIVHQSTINKPMTIIGNNQTISWNSFNGDKAKKFIGALLSIAGKL